MTDRQLFDMWRFEEEFPFAGWDFSHLDGRWEEEDLPWDYEKIVRERLKPGHELLDMETGGGEKSISLKASCSGTTQTTVTPIKE